MRIGIVCPYSLDAPGGVQAHVLALAHELRRRGHAVDVLAPATGPVPDFVTRAGREATQWMASAMSSGVSASAPW